MERKPVRIIYDTDIGGDCDDAGTLSMLHRLCDRGEAELLAVTHCAATPYAAGCIDSINRFFGRETPVGINYGRFSDERGVYAAALCEGFPNKYPPECMGTDAAPEDTLTVLRRTLAAAEDQSAVLVVTGSLASMEKLVLSPADEISPMTGKELIERKLQRTVIMGGRFYESWPMAIYADGGDSGFLVTWEWNIKGSGAQTAQNAVNEWPGELVFSSYEIGSYIRTMVGYPDRAPAGDPTAEAYRIHNQGKGRCSWDQTAMLEAVRPGVYWNYHAYGRVTVDDQCVTHWQRDDGCRHTYLLPKADYEDVRRVIDDLLDGK